jgi:hypothetical protein
MQRRALGVQLAAVSLVVLSPLVTGGCADVPVYTFDDREQPLSGPGAPPAVCGGSGSAASVPCDTGKLGVCASGVWTCVNGAPECTPVHGPSAERCDTPEDESCDGNPGCTGAPVQALALSGGKPEIVGVAVDAAGNAIVAGHFLGALEVEGTHLESAGWTDIFVASFAPSGKLRWAQRIGDAGEDRAAAVAVDAAGNVLVTGAVPGTSDADILVAKIDPGGTLTWSQRLGGAGYQAGRAITVDGAGNALVAGYTAGAVDLGNGQLQGAGPMNLFVLKLDPDGHAAWSELLGDGASTQLGGMAVDRAGNVLLTGALTGDVDLGGGALGHAGGADLFVAKLDPSGKHLWSRRFGDADQQKGAGVAADADGNVLVAGSAAGMLDLGHGPEAGAGGPDVLVLALDPDGQLLWGVRRGGADVEEAVAIAVNAAGDALVAGAMQGTIDLGAGPVPGRAFVAKLDRTGQVRWAKGLGEKGQQWIRGIADDGVGGVVIAGSFSYAVDAGNGPMLASDDAVFLARLSP